MKFKLKEYFGGGEAERKARDCRSIIISHSVIDKTGVMARRNGMALALAKRLATSLSCRACVVPAGGGKGSKGW